MSFQESLFDQIEKQSSNNESSFEKVAMSGKRQDKGRVPLSYRMRPISLDEYVGQEHILKKDGILRRAIERDIISSIILYGPPGTGKTSIAYLIAKHTKAAFRSLNAVLSGVQQIREEIDKAKMLKEREGRRSILFVDEVHRWNKAQQDALLPHVENGTVILIGTTTENPFFEVNKALLSRSRVFELKSLEKNHLEKILYTALHDKERGYGRFNIKVEDGVVEAIVSSASGDGRVLLNTLEFAVESSAASWPIKEGDEILISKEILTHIVSKKHFLYDKKADYHYDVISAFIKSIRGGDADAALYYLSLMCIGGEDPHFIFRRLLILSCEDIGLAAPSSIAIVNAAREAFDMVGFPEGNYFLAFATLYLATREKSNTVSAFFDILSYAKENQCEVPPHLKDSSRDKCLSHGVGYLYPHMYDGHWVPQQYLPTKMLGLRFYRPSEEGEEKKIKEMLEKRKDAIEKLEKSIKDSFISQID